MMYVRCECGAEWTPGMSIRGWPKYHCPGCGKEGPPDPDSEAMIIVLGIIAGMFALLYVVGRP